MSDSGFVLNWAEYKNSDDFSNLNETMRIKNK